MKWLSRGWWQYLFSRPWRADLTWQVVFCRMRGHPGEVFFNPGGDEPDHHCVRCGEDIG